MIRRDRLSLAFAFALALAIVSLGSVLSGPGNPAVLALRQLEAAASGGDLSAQQILSEYRTYADRRGTSTDAAALAGGNADRQFIAGSLRVSVRGLAPFSLRIDAVADLTDERKLASYVVERQTALAKLASAKRDAPITVALGFSQRPSVAALLDMARTHRGVPQQLLVEAHVRGERRFTQVFSPELSAAMVGQSNDEVMAALGATLLAMDQPLCGSAPEHIEWVVQSARLEIAAEDALALASQPTVVIVDPIDDVLGSAGTAVWTTVASWPNVTTALEDIHGRRPADDVCQEGK